MSFRANTKIVDIISESPSHSGPEKADLHMVFNRYCLVLVQPDIKAKEILLKTSSKSFKSEAVVIKVK